MDRLKEKLSQDVKQCTAYRSIINEIIKLKYPTAECKLKCHNDEGYSNSYGDNEPADGPGCTNKSGDECQYKFDQKVVGNFKLTSLDPELFFQAVSEKNWLFACKKGMKLRKSKH